MKLAAVSALATAGLIFIQLITGGNYLISGVSLEHPYTGLIVWASAAVSVILAFFSEPEDWTFRLSTVAVLILVSTAGVTSSKSIMVIHYSFGILAFASGIVAAACALIWNSFSQRETKGKTTG